MSHEINSAFTSDPPVFLLKDLTVRVLKESEYAQAGALLQQQHYLGDCPQGRQLLQVVEYQGHWVALLDWGPACWKLADRELHIGWTPQQRAERLGLSKGFERHRADYFRKHGRPKKLWIKSLNRNAMRILTSMDVPKQYQAALNRNSPEPVPERARNRGSRCHWFCRQKVKNR